MPEVTTTTATVATIKITLFTAILSFLEYFGIPQEPFSLLGALMFIDMITGITKQKAVNMYSDPKHFKHITSTRFAFWIVKKLVIIIAICSVAIFIKAVWFSATTLVTWAIAGFLMAEIYSIIQNSYIIYTGKFLPEFDATALVFRAILGFIRKMAEGKVKQIEEIEIKDDTK